MSADGHTCARALFFSDLSTAVAGGGGPRADPLVVGEGVGGSTPRPAVGTVALHWLQTGVPTLTLSLGLQRRG